MDDRTRTRRDHEKYLTLIEAIALVHQHSRPVQDDGRIAGYIEVTPSDIALRTRLARGSLGRTLDELPPQTRRLLVLIEERVAAECSRLKIERANFRFSRRDVRGWIGWSDAPRSKSIFIAWKKWNTCSSTGPHAAEGYVYEMRLRGRGPGRRAPLGMGLIDAATLQTASAARAYDGERSGQNGQWSAPGQGVVRGESAPGCPTKTARNPVLMRVRSRQPPATAENTCWRPAENASERPS